MNLEKISYSIIATRYLIKTFFIETSSYFYVHVFFFAPLQKGFTIKKLYEKV